MRNADPSVVGALLDDAWTGEDLGVLISTLMYLFGQVADDAPDRAHAILEAHRLALLRLPDATPSSPEI